jgi:DNA-binding IclR family transcriptional regulator
MATQIDDGGSGGVRSVRRALEILSLMNEERVTVSFRELQEETKLARTTLMRMLSTLEDYGLLWAVGNNRYAPGPGLLRWAKLASRTWELPADSRRALRGLAETTGETASIWVRQGRHRICVAQHESQQALRHVIRVGREGPLMAAATGRVLIRDLSDSDIAKIIAEAPGHVEIPEVQRWQAEVRKQGFAITHGEREDGLSVLAVPLTDENNRVLAALTVAGPTDRFVEARSTQYLAALHEAARAINANGFMNS